MNRDLSLREDVQRELDWEPIVHSSEIGVGIKDGVVTLMGVVDSYEAKHAAERAALRVRGVQALSSQLHVRLAGPMERTDADIAWAAANALSWNTLLTRNPVRVEVSNAWITLQGAVDQAVQRAAAEEAVANLAGVAGVTNLITVRPAVASEDMKQRIENALRATSGLDASRIVIDADGDNITLWGCVNSWSQREAAEQSAWSVPDVCEVSNHITVTAVLAAGT